MNKRESVIVEFERLWNEIIAKDIELESYSPKALAFKFFTGGISFEELNKDKGKETIRKSKVSCNKCGNKLTIISKIEE